MRTALTRTRIVQDVSRKGHGFPERAPRAHRAAPCRHPLACLVPARAAHLARFLAGGLGTIPEELIDAARVDGASYPQRLRRVSLPLLSPFPTVRAMNVLTTSTPPETTFVMMRALFLAISQGRIGYGLGLVWMLLAAVILFTILLLRLGKARVPSNARPVYSAP